MPVPPDEGPPHSGNPHDGLSADRAVLSGILDGIHRWRAERGRSAAGIEALKRRVQNEVDPLLGTRATSRILATVAPDGANLLTDVEPVLALFVGSRAASALISYIVTDAIVRS